MPKKNADIPPPLCLICRERPAIKAHLLPQAFVREIYHEPKADEKHMIIHPVTGQKHASNTGRFEKGILCSPCNNILGGYENAAFKLLKRLRSVKIGKKVGTQSFIDSGTYAFRVTVVDEFIRFACGILWKYATTEPDDPAHIDIGDAKSLFEQICFHGAAIPEEVDVFIERDLLSFAAFTDPLGVYYYCTPSSGRRGHKTSHRLAWFSVSGFTIYVKLNEPGISDHAPKKCWMRGRKTCFFNVHPRSLEVNRAIHESIGLTNDDLARLNKSLHAKLQSGEIKP